LGKREHGIRNVILRGYGIGRVKRRRDTKIGKVSKTEGIRNWEGEKKEFER
jgi:hypothetical protein